MIDVEKLRKLKGRRIYQFWLDEETGDITDVTSRDDVVQVIRCKDCKWYLSNMIKSPFDIDGFDRWDGLTSCQNLNGLNDCSDESYCSEGERRTDG